MSTIIKLIILALLIIFIAWCGVCAYSNFIAPNNIYETMPDPEKAAYSIYIKNTGNLILTNDYKLSGQDPGARIIILHGFWEINGNKFNYNAGDIILNENIFGEIKINRRPVNE